MSCTLRYPSADACSAQPRTECDEHKLQLALEVHLLSPRPQPQLVQLFPEAICQILSISNNVVLSFSRIGSASFALSDLSFSRIGCSLRFVWCAQKVCVRERVVVARRVCDAWRGVGCKPLYYCNILQYYCTFRFCNKIAITIK